jgi:uncharacterized protein with ParB-like and HNH nuclease domain
MEAHKKNFLNFIGLTNDCFVIPVYQRNYDWKKENCKKLFDDIENICHKNLKTYFMGSIVTYESENIGAGSINNHLVIDGQQRITSLMLLILAVHNYLKETGEITKFKSDILYKRYLVSEDFNGDVKVKLKSVKDDDEAFNALVHHRIEKIIPNSSITINYNYFIDRIKRKVVTPDEIFTAINSLEIINIVLKRKDEDDPQLIFESLNSTGVSLSGADLIRNFLLINENESKQKKFYTEYWNPMEINTQYKVTLFIRDYLTMKERKTPKIESQDIYNAFKEYSNLKYKPSEIENLLKDLLKFSKIWDKIVYCKDSDHEIQNALKKLSKLDITVTNPFLLEIFDDFNQSLINKSEVLEILKTTETFLFRRLICEVPTFALKDIFRLLCKEIKSKPDYKDNYVEIFKHILLKKQLNQRFPSNEEFSKHFVSKDIYSLTGKYKIYLLENLENFNHKERVDIEKLIEEGTLTIEHILPRKPKDSWKKEIGEGIEELNARLGNTIGNLTLTGYNSQLSNKPFLEKRDMEHGFKHSKLQLNKLLATLNKWDEENINKRAQHLLGIGLQIWERPKSKYKASVEEDVFYDLSYSDDFTSERISEFEFFNETHQVKTWKDFMTKICKMLYELEPRSMQALSDDKDFKKDTRTLISSSSNGMKQAVKIADEIYIESHQNTKSMISLVKQILRKFGFDEFEVKIYLKEKSASKAGRKKSEITLFDN